MSKWNESEGKKRDTDVVADVLICFDKNEAQPSWNGSEFVVVESVRRAVDEDGDEVMQLTGYIKKKQVKYLSAEKNFAKIDGSSFYMVKNKWDITDADITADNMEPHPVNSSAAVIVCDTKNSKITVGSIADLVGYSAAPKDYSKIVVANVTAVPNTYIVYK